MGLVAFLSLSLVLTDFFLGGGFHTQLFLLDITVHLRKKKKQV